MPLRVIPVVLRLINAVPVDALELDRYRGPRVQRSESCEPQDRARTATLAHGPASLHPRLRAAPLRARCRLPNDRVVHAHGGGVSLRARRSASGSERGGGVPLAPDDGRRTQSGADEARRAHGAPRVLSARPARARSRRRHRRDRDRTRHARRATSRDARGHPAPLRRGRAFNRKSPGPRDPRALLRAWPSGPRTRTARHRSGGPDRAHAMAVARQGRPRHGPAAPVAARRSARLVAQAALDGRSRRLWAALPNRAPVELEDGAPVDPIASAPRGPALRRGRPRQAARPARAAARLRDGGDRARRGCANHRSDDAPRLDRDDPGVRPPRVRRAQDRIRANLVAHPEGEHVRCGLGPRNFAEPSENGAFTGRRSRR